MKKRRKNLAKWGKVPKFNSELYFLGCPKTI